MNIYNWILRLWHMKHIISWSTFRTHIIWITFWHLDWSFFQTICLTWSNWLFQCHKVQYHITTVSWYYDSSIIILIFDDNDLMQMFISICVSGRRSKHSSSSCVCTRSWIRLTEPNCLYELYGREVVECGEEGHVTSDKCVETHSYCLDSIYYGWVEVINQTKQL